MDIEEEIENCRDMGYFISVYVLKRPLHTEEAEMIKQYQEWGQHFLIKNRIKNVKQRPLPTSDAGAVLQKSKKDDTKKRRRYKRSNKGRGQE